jgi:hypothetical protein
MAPKSKEQGQGRPVPQLLGWYSVDPNRYRTSRCCPDMYVLLNESSPPAT